MSDTLINLIDTVANKWAELLALVGGSTGLVGIIIFAYKTLTPLIVAKINKKSGVNGDLSKILDILNKINDLMNKLPEVLGESVKVELDNRESKKALIYRQILQPEKIEQLTTEINSKVEEVAEIVEDVKENITENAEKLENVIKARVVEIDE